jgi:hypothetical protein
MIQNNLRPTGAASNQHITGILWKIQTEEYNSTIAFLTAFLMIGKVIPLFSIQ